MLLAGDEKWHSQSGNNNTFCQDNELTWLPWELDEQGKDLFEFTKALIALRKAQPVLSRKNFLTGQPTDETDLKDVIWWNPEGREMGEEDWNAGFTRCFGMWLPGETLQEMGQDGNPRESESLLIMFNAHHEAVSMTLPEAQDGDWQLELTTKPSEPSEPGQKEMSIPARAVAVFKKST